METANQNGDGHTAEAQSLYARHADQYTAYANGSPARDLFDFGGLNGRRYSFADSVVWEALRAELDRIVTQTPSNRTLRVLDAGCGDLTWAVRMADYFEGMGRPYEIRGLDKEPEMIRQGEVILSAYRRNRGRALNVTSYVGNLEEPLPYESGRFNVTVSLFTVLNHIRRPVLPSAIRELMRVTRPGGRHISVVKAPGGERTAYVCGADNVRAFRQEADRLVIVEHDGSEHELDVTLISSGELRQLFRSEGGTVVDLFGVDLFVGPVLGRHRASPYECLPGEESVALAYFARVDAAHRRDPEALNYAGHVAIVVERRR